MLNINIYLESRITEVYDFGSQIEGSLKERFEITIRQSGKYNQLKVIVQVFTGSMKSMPAVSNTPDTVMTTPDVHWKKCTKFSYRRLLLYKTADHTELTHFTFRVLQICTPGR